MSDSGERRREPGEAERSEFAREAFTRNVGIIDDFEQAALHGSRVLVAGCGSVGGATVEPLVRLGVGGLVLADPDTYDLHNINRQACFRADVGLPKPIVLAERARAISPLVELRTFTEGLTAENMEDAFTDVTIVFDGIDNATSPWEKYLVHRYAVERRIPVLAGADLGGQPTLYVFDYRRIPRLGYGMVRERDVRSGREFQLTIAMLARKLPRDFLPVVRYMSETGAPWPQITYCADGIGVLATRAVVDLAVGRKLPRVVAADVHMLMRPWRRRLADRAMWLPEIIRTVRAVGAASPPASPLQSDPRAKLPDSLRPAVEAIRGAPSRSNTQPWRLRPLDSHRLEIGIDPDRTLGVRDPAGRHALAGIGCAVESAAAVTAVSWSPSENPAADGGAGLLEIGPLRDGYLTALGLVRTRRTARRALERGSIADQLGEIVADVRGNVDTELVPVGSRASIAAVAELAGEAARYERRDAARTLEALRWLRGSRREFDWDENGVPVGALGAGYGTELLLRAGKRLPGIYARACGKRTVRAVAAAAEERLLACGGLVLVAARDESAAATVDAGRALMATWLAAVRRRLAVQPVSAVADYPELHDALLESFGGAGGVPLCVLRIGRDGAAPPRAPTSRLPLDRILVDG